MGTPGPFPLATLCSFLPQEAATVRGPENSDVFPPPRSSAVAVTLCPTGTAWEGVKVKVTLPLELVLTALLPISFYHSLPEGLEKSSTTKGSCTELPDVQSFARSASSEQGVDFVTASGILNYE